MCGTCGCGDDSKVTVTNLETGTQEQMERSRGQADNHHHHHDHDGDHHHHHRHDHDHDHGHAHGHHHHHHHHHHGHGHSHTHEHADVAEPVTALAGMHRVSVDLERAILAKNDAIAERNRAWFDGREILALNLVSSPGAGKTALLERTIKDLAGEMPIFVIEGDQQTLHDAERIKAAGAPAVQVNTGTGCHLEADMIRRGLDTLRPAFGSVLMIENVGNLVCPALFDLGEKAKVVILSVTEGEDKPLKYPHMFGAADLMILSKIDLLPHIAFDAARCEAMARKVNPAIRSIRLSAQTGEGLGAWYDWLRAARGRVLEAAQ
jgi:hydrogenase nickel incorporation protein HypB